MVGSTPSRVHPPPEPLSANPYLPTSRVPNPSPPNSKCSECNKRVISTSRHINCSSCKISTHICCIPFVNQWDSIYTQRNENNWICITCCSDALPFNNIREDTYFIAAISEIWSKDPFNGTTLSRLAESSFNPLELNESEFSPFFDTDPDLQILNRLYGSNDKFSSDYYLENTFRTAVNKNSVTKENFSFIHHNIRGARTNLLNFQAYLKTLNFDFHVIAHTETRFNESCYQSYQYKGYDKGKHVYRTERVGGGVSMYVKPGIEYQLREDLGRLEDSIECLFIEIYSSCLTNSDSNIILGCIYRPPGSNLNSFHEHFETIMDKISSENKTCRLTGDFNLDILKADIHPPTQRYIDNTFSHSFLPIINKPTRSAETTHTCLDHILINNIRDETKILHGILYTDVTDHFPVFFIDLTISHKIDDTPRFKRCFDEKSKKKFASLLANQDWAGTHL